jgi:hypothetical protein
MPQSLHSLLSLRGPCCCSPDICGILKVGRCRKPDLYACGDSTRRFCCCSKRAQWLWPSPNFGLSLSRTCSLPRSSKHRGFGLAYQRCRVRCLCRVDACRLLIVDRTYAFVRLSNQWTRRRRRSIPSAFSTVASHIVRAQYMARSLLFGSTRSSASSYHDIPASTSTSLAVSLPLPVISDL